MSFKIIKKYSILLVLFVLAGIVGALGNMWNTVEKTTDKFDKNESILVETIEISYRQNARYIAKGIANCILEDMVDMPKTIESLTYSAYKCGAEHRSGGVTGDFFVFDRVSGRMLYDGSPDCLKGGINRIFDPYFEHIQLLNNFIAHEGECYMHENKELCVKAMEDLYNEGTTDSNSLIYWRFDKHYEWLESVVIPRDRLGFFGPVGDGFDGHNIQLQIVVGTQKDEVMAQYKEPIKQNKELKTLHENIINKLKIYVGILTALMLIMGFITSISIAINEQK